MLLRQLFDHESSTYTYLLADDATSEAVLIDPVLPQIERDLHLIQELGLGLKYVLDTHVHADHVTATGRIAQRTGAISVSGQRGPVCARLHVKQGDRLRFGSERLEVLETPGHTDDSLSYLVGDRVFTGDALLIRGCGRTDFQNGDPARLFDSINRVLFALPDETLVYPAHDYRGLTVSTIGEERRFNPRLAGKSSAEFVELMRHLDLGLPKKMMEAVPANRACGMPEAVS
jgi:sulfur dioxygenase